MDEHTCKHAHRHTSLSVDPLAQTENWGEGKISDRADLSDGVSECCPDDAYHMRRHCAGLLPCRLQVQVLVRSVAV